TFAPSGVCVFILTQRLMKLATYRHSSSVSRSGLVPTHMAGRVRRSTPNIRRRAELGMSLPLVNLYRSTSHASVGFPPVAVVLGSDFIYIERMLWRVRKSRGRPLKAPAAFIHPSLPTVAKQPRQVRVRRMS